LISYCGFSSTGSDWREKMDVVAVNIVQEVKRNHNGADIGQYYTLVMKTIKGPTGPLQDIPALDADFAGHRLPEKTLTGL
jgi:hypothetical protein